MIDTFRQRRDTAVKALQGIGWSVPTPEATMYLWVRLPEPWAECSIKFCTDLVEATGVALSPGLGFGKAGEGYVRMALVHAPEVLEQAIAKIAEFCANSPLSL
jgi:hypothetical protein